MRSKFLKQYLIVISLLTTLTSCMVGPNFHSPSAPKTNRFTEVPLPKKTASIKSAGKAGKAQYFNMGQDIPAEWWKLFHSQEINDLIQKGLENSPNLAAAQATLVQAKENVNAQVGALLFPSVTAGLNGTRQKANGASVGSASQASIFNLYNASVNVSYVLDVFGGSRRQIEALRDQVDYQRYLLEGAYLTLTANIVTTSITIASVQAQIDATNQLIREQENQLSIIRKQLTLGGASESDVLSQQTQVEQTRATLPPLMQSLTQAYHSLSVLVGDLPSDNIFNRIRLDKLNLPSQLPVSLPSSLVRQRPDIRASEALLAAASAQIGVATANLYPQLTLTGAFQYQKDTISNLINAKNLLWNYGAAIAQPIFNGGSLQAKKRAAIAGYDIAFAQYRQTVLQAFQNVADTLRALQHDAQTLRAQKAAEIAARNALFITQKQYQYGGVTYINVLNAQKQYQQTRINRIQAQAARYSDTAALFQALGGGWWNA